MSEGRSLAYASGCDLLEIQSKRPAGIADDRFLLAYRERRMFFDAFLPLPNCRAVFGEDRNGIIAEWRRKTVAAFELFVFIECAVSQFWLANKVHCQNALGTDVLTEVFSPVFVDSDRASDFAIGVSEKIIDDQIEFWSVVVCLLYTSPSPRDS